MYSIEWQTRALPHAHNRYLLSWKNSSRPNRYHMCQESWSRNRSRLKWCCNYEYGSWTVNLAPSIANHLAWSMASVPNVIHEHWLRRPSLATMGIHCIGVNHPMIMIELSQRRWKRTAMRFFTRRCHVITIGTLFRRTLNAGSKAMRFLVIRMCLLTRLIWPDALGRVYTVIWRKTNSVIAGKCSWAITWITTNCKWYSVPTIS